MSTDVLAQKPSNPPAAETDKVVVRNLNFYYGADARAQGRFLEPARRVR